MKSKILFPVLLCALLFSCKKDPVTPDSVDYFTFGVNYCFCIDQCATLYKYADAKLIKGVGNSCEPADYTFNGTALPADDLALAETLLNALPDSLFSSSETIFGCPDCADQGGYYVEIKKDGEVKSWRIDTRADDLPEWLKPYQQKIKDTIESLQ